MEALEVGCQVSVFVGVVPCRLFFQHQVAALSYPLPPPSLGRYYKEIYKKGGVGYVLKWALLMISYGALSNLSDYVGGKVSSKVVGKKKEIEEGVGVVIGSIIKYTSNYVWTILSSSPSSSPLSPFSPSLFLPPPSSPPFLSPPPSLSFSSLLHQVFTGDSSFYGPLPLVVLNSCICSFSDSLSVRLCSSSRLSLTSTLHFSPSQTQLFNSIIRHTISTFLVFFRYLFCFNNNQQ